MRIRTIKPEFWRSEDIRRLPRDVRLLFVGVWSYVDDNGVGVDDHRRLAADLFPLEDDPAEAREFVRDGLATLSRGLLILRYDVDGLPLLYVTGWDKHQRVDRPNKPRYPRPPEGMTSGNPAGRREEDSLSRDPRESLAPGTEEQGNRGTEETPLPSVGGAGGTRSARRPPRPPTAGTRIPDDFAVTEAMIAWARERTPLVGREDTEAFQDFWRSANRNAVKRDWVAAWRNWMRRAQHDAEARGARAAPNGTRLATADQRVRDTQALKRLYANPSAGPPADRAAERPQLTPGGDP